MNRRTFLTVGASLAALPVVGSPVSAAGDSGARPGGSRPRVLPGVRQFDLDQDGSTDVDFTLARDPAGRDRRVVHATSRGHRTRDYAVSVKSLHVSLGHIARGGTIRYEYEVGKDDTGDAPGEVWLYVQDERGGRHLVFHGPDHGGGHDSHREKKWLTRKVDREILGRAGRGFSTDWYEVRDLPNGSPWTGAYGGRGGRANLVDWFGKSATILAIGIGVGTPNHRTVHDVYYGALRVDGKSLGLFPVVDHGKSKGKSHGKSSNHGKKGNDHSKKGKSDNDHGKKGKSSGNDHGKSPRHGNDHGNSKGKSHGNDHGNGHGKKDKSHSNDHGKSNGRPSSHGNDHGSGRGTRGNSRGTDRGKSHGNDRGKSNGRHGGTRHDNPNTKNHGNSNGRVHGNPRGGSTSGRKGGPHTGGANSRSKHSH